MGQIKSKVLSAFGWKFIERLAIQGGNFIITLILARLLTPDDYGAIALVTVFISLANTLVQCGFNTALIQKKEVTEDDYTSVLFFSITISILLYFIIYACGPFLGSFYAMPGLDKVIRIMAIVLFPGAFNSIQVAYVTRDLKFRTLAISSFFSMLIGAFSGIVLAIAGYGVWALVAQQIATQFASCLIIFLMTWWYPKGCISSSSLKSMIPFGSKIFASNIMVTLFMDLRTIIIGRMYTSADLGYFNRGKQFPQAAMESINGTIQSVLLPVYAKEQENKDMVITMMRQTIRLTCFIVFPMMIGLACIAEPLIQLLLTDKWIDCVPFIQIFAFSYMCQPAQISSAQAYKALGDSTTPLVLEIFRKTTEIILLIVSLRFGVKAIAVSSVIAGIFSIAISFYPNTQKLNYSLKQQLGDLLPALLLSLLMAGIILVVGKLISNLIIKLIAEIVGGIFLYLFVAKVFKIQSYTTIVGIMKQTFRGK